MQLDYIRMGIHDLCWTQCCSQVLQLTAFIYAFKNLRSQFENKISKTCSIRVSNELGAGHPKAAPFSMVIAILSSSIISIFLAIVALCLHHQLSYIFTTGLVMSNAVAELSPFLAIVIILNGVAPILSGKINISHLFP